MKDNKRIFFLCAIIAIVAGFLAWRLWPDAVETDADQTPAVVDAGAPDAFARWAAYDDVDLAILGETDPEALEALRARHRIAPSRFAPAAPIDAEGILACLCTPPPDGGPVVLEYAPECCR